MIWSSAIFGHYKPKVSGWERRAQPGDIIAVRPIGEHNRWTETEKREFLIVIIDDFEFPQIGGLLEPLWDPDSFPVIPLKKRRFNIPLSDLEEMGVDLPRMLDRNEVYSPSIAPIKKIQVYDKLKKRKASKDDHFNLINLIKGRIV